MRRTSPGYAGASYGSGSQKQVIWPHVGQKGHGFDGGGEGRADAGMAAVVALFE